MLSGGPALGRPQGDLGSADAQARPSGLCGNFNQNQADDFRTLSGVVEGTAAAFANTWKTQAACPNVKNSFEDPCSLSVENGSLTRGEPSGCPRLGLVAALPGRRPHILLGFQGQGD